KTQFVIASPAQPGAAIQLDCFVAPLLAMTRKREGFRRRTALVSLRPVLRLRFHVGVEPRFLLPEFVEHILAAAITVRLIGQLHVTRRRAVTLERGVEALGLD